MSTPPSVEQLQKTLTELQAIKFVWSDARAKRGRCEDYNNHEAGEDVNELKVMELPCQDEEYERKMCFCKKHWTKERFDRAKEVVEENIRAVKEDLDFQEKLKNITRFAQIKDLVAASRVIIMRKQESFDRPVRFTNQEKRQVGRLLALLRKIDPKSSQFMDRGVAVNENLWLSGTAKADRYSSRAEARIHVTGLDLDERYKAFTRVPLTLGEAERFRGLMTECIEHVRIKSLIVQIEEKFGDELDEEEE